MTARYIVGDVFDALATLEPNSVDLVMTSPPFLALRSYLPAGHPDKAREIGSEATPADFIDTLLDVVEALDRVLAPHGSIVFELGDTYAGSGGAGGDYLEGGLRDGQERFDGSASRAFGTGAAPRPPRVRRPHGTDPMRPHSDDLSHHKSNGRWRENKAGWPLDKSLCGIPQAFSLSLEYGWNMLRPERRTPRQRVRNVIAWCRPNPPVGALADKYRPATSYLTVACKARDRYFDLDAVRGPISDWTEHYAEHPMPLSHRANGSSQQGDSTRRSIAGATLNAQGAPPLDFWVIPTQPYPGAHYATYPEQLCVIPIKSICPPRVCVTCGQPSRRIVEAAYERNLAGGSNGKRRDLALPDGHDHGMRERFGGEVMSKSVKTLGWSDCGHDNWRAGLTLDPFAGSGTTLQVATGHGRDAIGIDLDSRNADLALDRVGPLMLTVEHHKAQTPA